MTHKKAQKYLELLQKNLQEAELWQDVAPDAEAFLSQQPFAIDFLTATEWIQWIFIPKMLELIDAKQSLPNQMAITPYLEEALKEREDLDTLFAPLYDLEKLLQQHNN